MSKIKSLVKNRWMIPRYYSGTNSPFAGGEGNHFSHEYPIFPDPAITPVYGPAEMIH
jgi:hypothetical protein